MSLLQDLADSGIQFSLGVSPSGSWHFTIFDPDWRGAEADTGRGSAVAVTVGGLASEAEALDSLALNAAQRFPESVFAKAGARPVRP